MEEPEDDSDLLVVSVSTCGRWDSDSVRINAGDGLSILLVELQDELAGQLSWKMIGVVDVVNRKGVSVVK